MVAVLIRERGRNGGIAQLAEHELCKLGVTGSNPVASTKSCEALFATAKAKPGLIIEDGTTRACSSVG